MTLVESQLSVSKLKTLPKFITCVHKKVSVVECPSRDGESSGMKNQETEQVVHDLQPPSRVSDNNTMICGSKRDTFPYHT